MDVGFLLQPFFLGVLGKGFALAVVAQLLHDAVAPGFGALGVDLFEVAVAVFRLQRVVAVAVFPAAVLVVGLVQIQFIERVLRPFHAHAVGAFAFFLRDVLDDQAEVADALADTLLQRARLFGRLIGGIGVVQFCFFDAAGAKVRAVAETARARLLVQVGQAADVVGLRFNRVKGDAGQAARADFQFVLYGDFWHVSSTSVCRAPAAGSAPSCGSSRIRRRFVRRCGCRRCCTSFARIVRRCRGVSRAARRRD